MGPVWSFEGCTADVPRPILSRAEPPFVPAEEHPVPSNMNISQETVSQRLFPHRPTASRTDPVIVTVLSVQNNERWTSTQREWNELIIQDESHWNRVLCLSRQLKRKKVKINRVFGIQSEPVENQNRTCPVKSLFQVQMKRLTTPGIPCCVIWCDSVKFDFNSDLSKSLVKQWCEAYVQ